MEPAAVALHAVKRAEIFPGASVCVVGTGAIGLLAGQWAKLRGAGRAMVKGRSKAKSQIVRQCGLEYLPDARPDEEFDRVIEAVGSARALEESLLLIKPGGRLVLMGNPDGARTLSQDLYWRILRKQLTLTGTWNSSYGGEDSDWAHAVTAMENGGLRTDALASRVLEQRELAEGLAAMREGVEPYCKLILEW